MSTIQQYSPNSQSYKLSFLFKQQPSLAWQMVEQQCSVYTNQNIQVQDINTLSSIYSKIVQKLNGLQDMRQAFFHNKMQKLMAEPFVIRCYSNQAQNKQCLHEQKRKQMEMKLSLQTQKQNNQIFQHIIDNQEQKEKKFQTKINEVLDTHSKALESRLKRRQSKVQNISPLKKRSDSTKIPSENGNNPQGKSSDNTITLLDFSNIKNQKSVNSDYIARTQSQRIVSYNLNVDSSQSQDQYNISKLIKEENTKKIMAKKKNLHFEDE